MWKGLETIPTILLFITFLIYAGICSALDDDFDRTPQVEFENKYDQVTFSWLVVGVFVSYLFVGTSYRLWQKNKYKMSLLVGICFLVSLVVILATGLIYSDRKSVV